MTPAEVQAVCAVTGVPFLALVGYSYFDGATQTPRVEVARRLRRYGLLTVATMVEAGA